MELAFFTNIHSHYQISLGQAFANLLPGNFKLVCWESGLEEYKKLGWEDNVERDWLIKAWVSEQETKRALDLLQSADIIIWGYAPVSEINMRVDKGKLTFRYTERVFKKGRWRLFDPRMIIGLRKVYRLANRGTYHLLSVGPYCADDFKFLGLFKKRIWRWGYFPEVAKTISKMENKTPVILWAGRMVSWKRVDLLLEAAAWARKNGSCNLQLRIIGYGPEEKKLRSLAYGLGLSDICEFEGPRSPEDIGVAMEAADIYVIPSNREEGWGVVVNEAMSRGCCVIGSKSTGSVPWLICDGTNGRIFETKSVKNLGQIISWCANNPEQRSAMGKVARTTIKSLWSPEVAADRFLNLCNALESGRPSPYGDEGPCSAVF